MSAKRQCPRGHIYESDSEDDACPYCVTRMYPIRTRKMTKTSPDESLKSEKTDPTFFPGIKSARIPLCPHCGRPVRRDMPHPQWPIVGSIDGDAYDGKTPWNYKWDGKCENCGHDFSITMVQRLHSPEYDRRTTIRGGFRQVDIGLIDAQIGLSGVEIEQHNSTDGTNKFFLSTNELKYLINALKESPLLMQLDWNEDYT